MRINNIIPYILITVIAGLFSCSDDTPEPTGKFSVTFTGGIDEQLQGNARFELIPGSTNGRLMVTLEESMSRTIRLTFFNPDPAQIFLEPGTYTVVVQAGQNVPDEVLVEFLSEAGSFSATSGVIEVGIVKNTQIKGNLVNVVFSTLNITCRGNFDAIPK
jgi:hypothetical protein